MANLFQNAETIATVAAKLVSGDLSLAGKISRDLEANFRPGNGDVVNVRVRGAVRSHSKPASDKSTPLVADEVAEQFIPVTLSDHVYDLVTLSEADMSLEIDSFAARVLAPQAAAIRAHIERAVVAELQATPETLTIAYDANAPAKTFTAIRKQLRDNGIGDEAKMIAAVGTGVFGEILDAEAGDAITQRGFQLIESSRLADDEIVAFIPEAFTLVARAPEVPSGAPHGASVNEGGFALRWVDSYDPSLAVDRSLVSVLLAVTDMPLPVVDEVNGTVDLVTHGGAVRVLTSTIPA